VLKLLADSGFLMDVGEGQLLVAEGVGERELYLLVDGSAKVVKDDVTVSIIAAGEIIGEVAFFREAGVRTASVVALENSRVLVIRYKFLEELRSKDPDAAWSILFYLGRLLADRLQATTASCKTRSLQ
jgi:CRP-like cAMP-binding protein